MEVAGWVGAGVGAGVSVGLGDGLCVGSGAGSCVGLGALRVGLGCGAGEGVATDDEQAASTSNPAATRNNSIDFEWSSFINRQYSRRWSGFD